MKAVVLVATLVIGYLPMEHCSQDWAKYEGAGMRSVKNPRELLSRLRGGTSLPALPAQQFVNLDGGESAVPLTPGAIRDTMEVAADKIGVVIGRAGATIKQIEQMSQCQVPGSQLRLSTY